MAYERPQVIVLGTANPPAQEYEIDGEIIVQPVSEWGEGIRQGSPDYADIDHAFFKVFEDFRGGEGVLHYMG
jgi:hypothetical protein